MFVVFINITHSQLYLSFDFRFVITQHVNVTRTGDYVGGVGYAAAGSVIASPANLGTQI